MKNSILKIASFVIAAFVFVGLQSCEDTTEKLAVSGSPTAAVLANVNFTQLTLDAVNTSNPAVTLSWDSADYGQQTAVNYAVQFANDEAFTNPVTATSLTGQNAATLSMAALNNAAGNAGLNPFEWGTLYARVVSSLGTQASSQATSNTISFMVYPYFNYAFSDYYLVGDATAPGWNNNNNNPALFRSATNENEFTYTAYFGDGHFKILETKGLWQPQWGTNDGSLVNGVYSGSIDVNPGGGTDPGTLPNNNNTITAGYYKFTINFASKEYSFEAYDASGATSPTSLAIEGSSLTASTPLTQSSFNGHIWNISNVRLKPGNVKFVTGSGDTWGSDTAFSGVATNGGADIPVIVEDDYDVWFNDLTGDYILIPLNL